MLQFDVGYLKGMPPQLGMRPHMASRGTGRPYWWHGVASDGFACC
jgi:hypothetical protein